MYVSRGPALQGELIGYDLARSFKERRPIEVRRLPEDPHLSREQFQKVQESLGLIKAADRMLKLKRCQEAKPFLEKAANLFREQTRYYLALGNYHWCLEHKEEARVAYRHAVALQPAYLQEREFLKRRLEK